MVNIQKLGVLLTVLLLLYGCGPSDPGSSQANSASLSSSSATQDPFVLDEGESMQYQYGFGIKTPDVLTMDFTGEPLELSYYIENSNGADMQIGLMITVNGFFQPYRLGNDPQEACIHTVHIPAGGETVVPVAFTPVCGTAGDTLTVRYMCMLNPDVRPDHSSFVFGNNHHILQIYPRSIRMEKEAPVQQAPPIIEATPQAMSEDQVSQYMTNSRGELQEQTALKIEIDNQQNDNLNGLSVNNQRIHFRLLAYGGLSGTYAVTLFINHVPVGSPMGFEIKNGHFLTEKDCEIDLTVLDVDTYHLAQYNTLYAIAVPLSDSSDYFVEKSFSFVFAF